MYNVSSLLCIDGVYIDSSGNKTRSFIPGVYNISSVYFPSWLNAGADRRESGVGGRWNI